MEKIEFEFEFNNNTRQISIQCDNYNQCERIIFRLNQLKKQYNAANNEITKRLIELSFDNASRFIDYYYNKIVSEYKVSPESVILDKTTLKGLFQEFDEILMYCYAFESIDYSENKDKYIKLQKAFYNVYKTIKHTDSLDMEFFVLPFTFKGRSGIETKSYFNKLSRTSKTDEIFSLDEIENLTPICVVLDPCNDVDNRDMIIPMGVHELSHYIRLQDRETRNKEVIEIIFKSLSIEISKNLIIDYSNNSIKYIDNSTIKCISNVIDIKLHKFFKEFTIKNEIKDIRFYDLIAILKSFFEEIFVFKNKLDIYSSNTADCKTNIKKAIVDLQKYIDGSISSNYYILEKKIKNNEITNEVFIRLLHASIIYDALFESADELKYWYSVKEYLDDFDFHFNDSFFNNCINDINVLINQYQTGKDFQITFDMLQRLYSTIVNKIQITIKKRVAKSDFKLKEELNNFLLSMYCNNTKFETELKELFKQYKEYKEQKRSFDNLFHELSEIKTVMNTYQLVVKSAFKSNDVLVIKNIEEKDINYCFASECFDEINKCILNAINTQDDNYLFLLTHGVKNALFTLGAFDANRTQDFVNKFDKTISVTMGKYQIMEIVRDTLDLYKESFADILMCWLLDYDVDRYSAFCKRINEQQYSFEDVTKLGVQASVRRQNIVLGTLDQNMLDYNYINIREHFNDLKKKLEEIKELDFAKKTLKELYNNWDTEVKNVEL